MIDDDINYISKSIPVLTIIFFFICNHIFN